MEGVQKVKDRAGSGEDKPKGRRVAAVVALTLLEVIRRQDLPTEVLESEDTAVTLPRRLGLSEVVERQIRLYREEVRKGRRISDEEVRDLVRLVIRRPDSDEVFFKAGKQLAGGTKNWPRMLPSGVAYAYARRTVARRLKRLFGRRIGGFAQGPFTLEGRAHLFIQSDPGGDACQFLSGFCESIVRECTVDSARVLHSQCQARGDALCRWTVLAEERVRREEGIPELLAGPEPAG